MKYNLAAITIMMFVLLFSTDAISQPHRFGRGGKGNCRLDGLNLTEDQQKKIDDLRDSHWNEVGKLHDELDKLKIEKRTMMRGDNLDKRVYIDSEKKMSELREKIALTRAEHKMAIYDVLTPEQKEKFQKFGFGNDGMERGGGFHRNMNKGFCR